MRLSNIKEPNRIYYFTLRQQARNFRVNLSQKKWCNLWHTHFDWNGFGNRGWVHRRTHITALLIALCKAHKELKEGSSPYQVFALANENDSGGDAIFVHTPNPKGTEFPFKHEGHEIEQLPPWLAGLINLKKYRVFVNGKKNRKNYAIQPK